MERITTHLKKLPLFRELDDQDLKEFNKIMKLRHYKSKMTVYMQDDIFNRVFFILKGKIKIFKNDMTGKEQIVSILQSGDMFPLAVFLKNGNYPANAQVLEDCTLITINIEDLEKILVSHAEISIKLFRLMGERIIELQDRLEEQILHNTTEQIILLLLRLCKSYGQKGTNDEFVLHTHFTNRQLANMVGSTRETVSRTLNKLKKQKHLYFDEKGFLHLYPEKLKAEVY
ncbi:Crp/Fnr family transcriptional regulator [Calidifontibacillus oryziterrae]|uniref:Crp/Fnr family transcriptional regulator n=1 Tax=Calidifontibacillus oryziterrae TaxID=1191699 RepID=UPI0002D44255|nr:Crp/Fnr family transcriptional regulator [Calidifontibacillus oryziterrae]